MDDLSGDIGTTAGKIYTEVSKFNGKGACDVTEVKKYVNANENVFLMAIGWLARENKVVVGREKKGLTVNLRG